MLALRPEAVAYWEGSTAPCPITPIMLPTQGPLGERGSRQKIGSESCHATLVELGV